MLKEKLLEDYKVAVKSRDYIKRSIVQILRAAIAFEEKYRKLDDNDIFIIIKKEIKRRRDAYPDYLKSNDILCIFELKKEIEILNSYLPGKMSEDEINKLIDKAIDELDEDSKKNMRKIIISVLNKSKGRADTKLITDMVKERLKKD